MSYWNASIAGIRGYKFIPIVGSGGDRGIRTRLTTDTSWFLHQQIRQKVSFSYPKVRSDIVQQLHDAVTSCAVQHDRCGVDLGRDVQCPDEADADINAAGFEERRHVRADCVSVQDYVQAEVQDLNDLVLCKQISLVQVEETSERHFIDHHGESSVVREKHCSVVFVEDVLLVSEHR